MLGPVFKMAASDSSTDESLYPIAVLIDELKNEDVQVYMYIYIIVLIEKVIFPYCMWKF